MQLGSSVGAIAVGLAVGPLGARRRRVPLLGVQVGFVLLCVACNAKLARDFPELPPGAGARGAADAAAARRARARRAPPRPPSPRRARTAARADGDGDEWWRSHLILSMGLWTFGIIFCKTIVEYQYNVLVSARFSAERMVSLTGCLYAAAGVVSSLVNVVGTPLLLQRAGMLPAILATPACMLGGAALVLARPGAWRRRSSSRARPRCAGRSTRCAACCGSRCRSGRRPRPPGRGHRQEGEHVAHRARDPRPRCGSGSTRRGSRC